MLPANLSTRILFSGTPTSIVQRHSLNNTCKMMVNMAGGTLEDGCMVLVTCSTVRVGVTSSWTCLLNTTLSEGKLRGHASFPVSVLSCVLRGACGRNTLPSLEQSLQSTIVVSSRDVKPSKRPAVRVMSCRGCVVRSAATNCFFFSLSLT